MASAKISNFVLRMDEIQKLVDPDLKKLGFKKSARTYNHSIEKGIIRVIHFQMGAFDPPNIDATPVPQALKPDLYGKFAVNIGVYVAEIAQAAFPHKERKFVSESSCALRMRLGRTKNKEFWWNLSAPIDVVAENVRTLLLADGMAFLNQFSTRAAIISEWVQF